MIKQEDIIDEKNKILRQISKEVIFPLTKEDKTLIKNMIKYLERTQNPKIAEKEELRPGIGLSAVQLGVLKRFFVIAHEVEEKVFKEYVIINPKIISHSEELTFVEEGEGCLSINRDIEGIVPRYARITVEYNDIDGNKLTIRLRDEISAVFQHEIDHLNGILFIDRIDKKNPYKNIDYMRPL